MAWLRIDDGFTENPKIARLTDRELRVWLRLLCWAARQRSGSIPAATTSVLVGLTAARLHRYAEIGLLDDVGGGEYEIHDWAIYNPPKLDAHKLDERTKDALDRFPAASKNELAAIIGGRRKDALAAIDRFREPPAAGSGNHREEVGEVVPGTDREPPADDSESGSGNHLGTGSRAPARARDAHSRARVPRPVPVNPPVLPSIPSNAAHVNGRKDGDLERVTADDAASAGLLPRRHQ